MSRTDEQRRRALGEEAQVPKELPARDVETPVQAGPSREAPPLTPANVLAMQRAAGNHALARRIAPQRSGGRRLARMRITTAVLNGQYVGTSQNLPGPDATLRHEDRDYGYHYHANNYRDPDLTSITLTVFSQTSGRRQHMTATEDRGGRWHYRGEGDRIVPDRDLEDKLRRKIELLEEAQGQVRQISSADALNMSLGDVIANSEGRRGW